MAVAANHPAISGKGRRSTEPPNAGIAKEVMTELDIKKLQAPDFMAIRPGIAFLVVISETEVPSNDWAERS